MAARDAVQDIGLDVREAARDAEARRVLVAAAAEVVRDPPNIHVVLRSHADSNLAVGQGLEEDHCLDFARGQRQIDDALRIVVRAPARRQHRVVHVKDRQTPFVHELHRVQERADQFQLAEAVAVEDAAGHRRRLDARFHSLPADLERSRRDVRMMEGARIGEDRQVDVGRDLERHRHAERADHVEHHLTAGGGRLVEPVQRPVHPVARVVIDVDDVASVEAGDTGARQIAALHDDHRVGIGVSRDGRRDFDPIDAWELEVVIGGGIGVEDADLLSQRVERERHGQLGSDRVAVGPRVGGQQERLSLPHLADNLLKHVRTD